MESFILLLISSLSFFTRLLVRLGIKLTTIPEAIEVIIILNLEAQTENILNISSASLIE